MIELFPTHPPPLLSESSWGTSMWIPGFSIFGVWGVLTLVATTMEE